MMQLSGRILALHLAILDLTQSYDQRGWNAQIIANGFVSNPVTLYYPCSDEDEHQSNAGEKFSKDVLAILDQFYVVE